MASSSVCEMKGFEIQTSNIRSSPKRASEKLTMKVKSRRLEEKEVMREPVDYMVRSVILVMFVVSLFGCIYGHLHLLHICHSLSVFLIPYHSLKTRLLKSLRLVFIYRENPRRSGIPQFPDRPRFC